MAIQRIAGKSRGRSRAVVHNGYVYTVATDNTGSETIAEQTRRTLAVIEANLIEAGSDKTRILQATIYLTDMSAKAAMDEAWCDWIGPDEGNWPQCACVGAALAEDHQIEVVVTAALP